MEAVQRLFQQGQVWVAAPKESTVSEVNLRLGALNAPVKNKELEQFIPFGNKEIDSVLSLNGGEGGLKCGALHEWFFDRSVNFPPHVLLTHLAGKSLKQSFLNLSTADQKLAIQGKLRNLKFALWIGKESWPSGYILHQATLLGEHNQISLLNHCLFTNPKDEREKLWNVVTALRSGAVATIIAELHGAKLPLTKRLSLAAKKGQCTALIIRDLKERNLPSAAHTRWIVSPQQSASGEISFMLELIASKGRRSLCNAWKMSFEDNY